MNDWIKSHDAAWLAQPATGFTNAEVSRILDRAEKAERERDEARQQLAERQKFKDWTHARLDQGGVPHHPPGTHGEHGCRIGDRMDWLFGQLAEARQQVAVLTARNAEIEAMDTKYMEVNMQLTEDVDRLEDKVKRLRAAAEKAAEKAAETIRRLYTEPLQPFTPEETVERQQVDAALAALDAALKEVPG